MIKYISIENIALIDSVEINLSEGLNILSGETGAGKSIIIDSINFVLGERADKSLIRHGKKDASVEVVFETEEGCAAELYLNEAGIACDGTIIVSRTMSDAGKSECRVNRKPVNLQTLRELVAMLVDLHAQHEHQSLMNAATHINILDGFADTKQLLCDYTDSYNKYNAVLSELKHFATAEERERKLDILQFQINEIEKAALKEDEEEKLVAARAKLNNMEKILSATQGAIYALDGEESSAIVSVSRADGYLKGILSFDESLTELLSRLDGVKIELRDIVESLKNNIDFSDFDGAGLEMIEKRLQEVRALKRKYGNSLEEISAFYDKIKVECDNLSNAEERIAELEKQRDILAKDVCEKSNRLYEKRLRGAQQFEKSIVSNLKDLGMVNSRFAVDIKHTDIISDLTKNGGDVVEFLISANIGEPLKPLSKIASGGELSRFMLGLKNIIAELDGIDTLIFDEIDTGISGNIAKVVAEKLKSIAIKRQVIAVTHLPQIAAMADVNFLIEKSSDTEKTTTSVTRLAEEKSVILELVRLTGGAIESTTSYNHAKELKDWADAYKSTLIT